MVCKACGGQLGAVFDADWPLCGSCEAKRLAVNRRWGKKPGRNEVSVILRFRGVFFVKAADPRDFITRQRLHRVWRDYDEGVAIARLRDFGAAREQTSEVPLVSSWMTGEELERAFDGVLRRDGSWCERARCDRCNRREWCVVSVGGKVCEDEVACQRNQK